MKEFAFLGKQILSFKSWPLFRRKAEHGNDKSFFLTNCTHLPADQLHFLSICKSRNIITVTICIFIFATSNVHGFGKLQRFKGI